MNKYAFSYYGEPSFKSSEEGKKHMSEWRVWMQSLGTSMVDPGVPLKEGKTVSSGGVKDGSSSRTSRLTGYSIVEAESVEKAIEMAKTCPHLRHGTIDVAEVMKMEMEM